ncbi:MAG: hypothetical protein LBG81_00655 [Coriobacteriaceae bacterium]|jgi:hypothetical protein|nr:hypothetical protein [Coriobacteriaceae bacterium]
MDAPEEIRRKEDECIRRYHADMQGIEERQEETRNAQRALREIQEQLAYDNTRTSRDMDAYLGRKHLHPGSLVTTLLDDMATSRARLEGCCSDGCEELSRRQKRLAEAYRDRERSHREELRGLSAQPQEPGSGRA